MDNKTGLGLVLLFTGITLIVAHLVVVGDIYRRGADPDEYADSGGSAVASSYAMPMGAGAIGIGVLLCASGLSFLNKPEERAESDSRRLTAKKLVPIGVTVGGLLLMALHVAMLRSLTLRVEAVENDPNFIPEGPAFEAEKAETRLELERVNSVFYIGMALAAAGLAMNIGRQSKREPDPTG